MCMVFPIPAATKLFVIVAPPGMSAFSTAINFPISEKPGTHHDSSSLPSTGCGPSNLVTTNSESPFDQPVVASSELLHTPLDNLTTPTSGCKRPCLEQSDMPDQSKRYFVAELQGPNAGVCKLVAGAFAKSNDSDLCANMDEARFHMDITKLCVGMSHSQRMDFSNIMSRVPFNCESRPIKDMDNISPESPVGFFPGKRIDLHHTRLPSTSNDIDSIYLDGCSTSIMANIPSPIPTTVNGHAYVSLKSIADHFLAHGYDIDDITRV